MLIDRVGVDATPPYVERRDKYRTVDTSICTTFEFARL